jgi:hypothetical protein
MLIEMMEIKGLKMLKNVKTRWISFVGAFKEDFSIYMPILAKMYMDNTNNQATNVS